MGIIILVGFGVIMAALAKRKGYNPVLWFLASGLLGLLILASLPFVNEKSKLPEAERASKKKTGDLIGGILSGLAIVLGIVLGLIGLPE